MFSFKLNKKIFSFQRSKKISKLSDCRDDKWKTECQYCKNEYPLPFYLVFRSIFLLLSYYFGILPNSKNLELRNYFLATSLLLPLVAEDTTEKTTVLDPFTYAFITYPFNTKIFSLSWTKLSGNKLSTSWVHTHKWEQCYQTV